MSFVDLTDLTHGLVLKLGLDRIWIFGLIPDNPANELPDPDIRPVIFYISYESLKLDKKIKVFDFFLGLKTCAITQKL